MNNFKLVGQRRTTAWLLASGLVLFVAIGARWLWLFRRGQPLDIDEAGYLGFSMFVYSSLIHNGLRGYIVSLESSGIQAPLTSALAALFYCITGPHPIVGFAVPLLFGAAIIAATYFMGTSLGSRRIAMISTALVASCPIIITYSRAYHFALPATFMTTMALLALLRSQRFRQIGWAAVFGVSLGLMPLARTMTIAFVPGIVLGALVYVTVDQSDRRRRLYILMGSLVLAVATAATWLGPNGRQVFGYLLNFGYGNHAVEYGPAAYSRYRFADWLNTAQTVATYVYLPHFFIMLVGALSLLWLGGKRIAGEGPSAAISAFAFAPVLPIVIFIIEALVVLTTTQTKGSAFIAPIVPAGIVLAVWSWSRVSGSQISRQAMVAVAGLAVVLATVPSIDLRLSRVWRIKVPVIGAVTVIDGRGTIQRCEANAGFASNNPSRPLDPSQGTAWVNLSATTATTIRQMGGALAPTAFGFRHYLYNVNTVGLQQWIAEGGGFALVQVDPIVTRDTVSGDLDWLTRGDAATASLLLTSDDDKAQFLPLVDHSRMVDAARHAGFQPLSEWAMPNGHQATLWRRSTPAIGLRR